jgi:hypothetical protein
MKKILLAFSALVLIGSGCVAATPSESAGYKSGSSTLVLENESAKEKKTPLGLPLERATERVTKKPFDLYVTPKTSPVSPERFSGYHAGVDFETFEDEQDRDVVVAAVCDGALALKKISDGYGGVAVQRCLLENRPVTVVYGHLRFESITAEVGDALKRGEMLGVLGKGYSVETDGERKHLHLGIHEGTDVTVRGYVQTKSEAGQWLDARLYFPL